ncbi:Structural maintenance of chromosomes protein 2-1 [Abeliophyllum distichum]|uniref:Structural maintenance of chromosomes protein 2-1 n=1 Tax=Abeliophyllum distichum TaxID=126358 RepID=A0ABD1VRP3_9LAMI
MKRYCRDLVKATSVLKNQEDILMTEKENAAKRNLEELKQSEEEKAKAVKIAEVGAVGLKRNSQELSKSLEEHEKEYQLVRAVEMKTKCLEDQLGDTKIEVGRTETELKQLQTRISHCEKDLKEKNSQLLSKREEAVAVENELKLGEKMLKKFRRLWNLLPMKRVVWKHCKRITLLRSRVKGVVAKLIKVKDRSAMTALEVASGGKLYNVVVDTENTGKQLLQNGGLRRRVTIIPLNKIQSHPLPQSVQTAAVRLVGKGNDEVALSLVGYDEELQLFRRWFVFSRHRLHSCSGTFKPAGQLGRFLYQGREKSVNCSILLLPFLEFDVLYYLHHPFFFGLFSGYFLILSSCICKACTIDFNGIFRRLLFSGLFHHREIVWHHHDLALLDPIVEHGFSSDPLSASEPCPLSRRLYGGSSCTSVVTGDIWHFAQNI